MNSFEANVSWGQTVGTRKSQQDHGSISSWPNGFQLLVLADGMGGVDGGREASHLVVESFKESFISNTEAEIRTRLLNGLEIANVKIFEFVRTRPDLKGMGSTLLAVAFDGEAVRWISVGDSPFWLYREGKLQRLNENHSMAAIFADKVVKGEMTAEEAATAPERTQLLEAVHGQNIEQVDLPEEEFSVEEGDLFILASDGVETCSLSEIEELLAVEGVSSREVVTSILEKVQSHERNSQDNSTVMTMHISESYEEVKTV